MLNHVLDLQRFEHDEPGVVERHERMTRLMSEVLQDVALVLIGSPQATLYFAAVVAPLFGFGKPAWQALAMVFPTRDFFELLCRRADVLLESGSQPKHGEFPRRIRQRGSDGKVVRPVLHNAPHTAKMGSRFVVLHHGKRFPQVDGHALRQIASDAVQVVRPTVSRRHDQRKPSRLKKSESLVLRPAS